jgi:hypothetical protein
LDGKANSLPVVAFKVRTLPIPLGEGMPRASQMVKDGDLRGQIIGAGRLGNIIMLRTDLTEGRAWLKRALLTPHTALRRLSGDQRTRICAPPTGLTSKADATFDDACGGGLCSGPLRNPWPAPRPQGQNTQPPTARNAHAAARSGGRRTAAAQPQGAWPGGAGLTGSWLRKRNVMDLAVFGTVRAKLVVHTRAQPSLNPRWSMGAGHEGRHHR